MGRFNQERSLQIRRDAIGRGTVNVNLLWEIMEEVRVLEDEKRILGNLLMQSVKEWRNQIDVQLVHRREIDDDLHDL